MSGLTEQEKQAQKDAIDYQNKLDGVVGKLKIASQVGMCVLDRDNHLGANAGTEGAFLATHFNSLADAGFPDRGTQALVVRELTAEPVKLDNCAAGAIPVGGIQLPARGMGA